MRYDELPRRQKLVIKSLAGKWFRKSTALILTTCPFCEDARNNNKINCDRCLVDKEICSNRGHGGYLLEIMKNNGYDVAINEIDNKYYRKMINLFLTMLKGDNDRPRDSS